MLDKILDFYSRGLVKLIGLIAITLVLFISATIVEMICWTIFIILLPALAVIIRESV